MCFFSGAMQYRGRGATYATSYASNQPQGFINMPDHRRTSSNQYYQDYSSVQTPTSGHMRPQEAVVTNTNTVVSSEDVSQEYDHSYSTGSILIIHKSVHKSRINSSILGNPWSEKNSGFYPNTKWAPLNEPQKLNLIFSLLFHKMEKQKFLKNKTRGYLQSV